MECVLLLVLLCRPSLPLSRDSCVFDRAAFALIGGPMLTVLDVTERCGDRMRINLYSNESEQRYSEIIMFFIIRFLKTLITLLNCINCT